MTDLERRRTRRYKLADPVDYWWLAPSGSVQSGRGMTFDVSSNGVMVIARKCPPEGVRIQTTIHVARQNGDNRPLELHGEGIVVRIELGKGTQFGKRSRGFAASMHFYSELSKDSGDSDRDTQGTSERRNAFIVGRVAESGRLCMLVSPFSGE